MKIKCLGHACFLVKGEKVKILIDPYNDTVGYPIVNRKVDILTMSHCHGDHCDSSWVEFEEQICIPDTFHFRGVEIKGFASYHDDANGEKRGDNVIFEFIVDGVTICHLGDLGHMLSDKLAKRIGSPDVLMIPVGGNYTIDAKMAKKVVEQLKPKLTIPMHYKTDICNATVNSADEFMELMGGEYLKGNSIEITKSTAGVVALNYK